MSLDVILAIYAMIYELSGDLVGYGVVDGVDECQDMNDLRSRSLARLQLSATKREAAKALIDSKAEY